MTRQLFPAAAVLALGIVIGLISARWETAGDIAPHAPQTTAASVETVDGENGTAKVVVVNGETHDFGTMEQNTKRSHSFIIRNDGRLPLKLKKGSTTCKCTLSEVGRDIIPYGETAEVTLEWEAKTGENEFSQSAEIGTNDPDRPSLRLVVHGFVRQSIKGDRGEFSFSQISAHDDAERRINVYSYLHEEFKVVGHEWRVPGTAEFFDLTVTPLSAEAIAKEKGAKAGVEVALVLKPGLPLGALDQSVRLLTNLEGQPNIEFPVVGKIVSDISLFGPKTNSDAVSINLGSLTPGEGAKATVYLLVKGPHRDATKIQLKEVKPAGVIKVELGERVSDNPKVVRFPLTVEVPPGSEPANYLGVGDAPSVEVIFDTDHPHLSRLVVKVKFLIKDEVR